MGSSFQVREKADLYCEHHSHHLFYWEEVEVLFRYAFFCVYGKWINVVCITQSLGYALWDISEMGKVQQSGDKMSPLLNQYSSNVYDPPPAWCAYVCG